jgi:outer membrane protein OmpA-like peptidoglycan-associated protein
MRRAIVAIGVIGLVAATAGSAHAQRTFAYEAGVFAQYTKFADTTHLKSGGGVGALFGFFVLPHLALEYEAQVTPTSSPTQSKLQAWDNRVDAVLNLPIGEKTLLLVGGGWTGSNFRGDTTHHAYDQGFNVLVGLRQCMNDAWSLRLEAVGDFKTESAQTPGRNASTQTYSGRLGVSWMLGGNAKNNPCRGKEIPPPPPAPAPYVAPAPPPPPPPAPRPEPRRAEPAPPPPAPAPARARELFTLKGVLFEFDKSTLTRGAKDTLEAAVRYLKDHDDVRVEIQGHTDSKGSEDYNVKLGMRRAESVKAYLGTQGIRTERISTRSFGKTQPVADNQINGKDNPAGRALNRRVVIIEVP